MGFGVRIIDILESINIEKIKLKPHERSKFIMSIKNDYIKTKSDKSTTLYKSILSTQNALCFFGSSLVLSLICFILVYYHFSTVI